MNKLGAYNRFKKYLKTECPQEGCDAKPDELCDTAGVWIHLQRMLQSDAWKD